MKTLNGIRAPEEKKNEDEDTSEKKENFVHYRREVTDDFERSLQKFKALCKVIRTIRKIIWNCNNYIMCPRCSSCYVGFSEGNFPNSPWNSNCLILVAIVYATISFLASSLYWFSFMALDTCRWSKSPKYIA